MDTILWTLNRYTNSCVIYKLIYFSKKCTVLLLHFSFSVPQWYFIFFWPAYPMKQVVFYFCLFSLLESICGYQREIGFLLTCFLLLLYHYIESQGKHTYIQDRMTKCLSGKKRWENNNNFVNLFLLVVRRKKPVIWPKCKTITCQ